MAAQRKLAIMARQASESLRRGWRDLQAATSGTVRAAVDPSRGVILSIYVDRPGMWERVEKGEKVGYVIIAVGVLGAAVAVWQFFYLFVVRVRVRRQLRDLDRLKDDNPLGRVLLAFKGDPSSIEEDAEIAELRITEAVLRETPRLERFQAFLRLAVAAGPLLGLIGCVIGMIITFQSVTEAGSSDPKLMANGISQAMVATVLGIGIAVPLLFANALLVSLSRYVLQILDEQTTGILAETLERRKNLAA
jgi:biopolymer transport protein ExbB